MKTSLCFFYDDDLNIYFQKRDKNFKYGRYGCFGGKSEKNESYLKCLKREISEELGIVLKDNKIKFFTDLNVKLGNNSFQIKYYLYKLEKNEIKKIKCVEGKLEKCYYDKLLEYDFIKGSKKVLKKYITYLEKNYILCKNNLRILALSDLHGKMPLVRFNKNEFDCIVLVGDIFGDLQRECINKYIKKKTDLLKKREIKKAEKIKISDFISKKDMKNLEIENTKLGEKILKYVNSFEKPVFLVMGNHDNPKILDGMPNHINSYEKSLEDLIPKYKNIYLVQNKIIEFKKVNFCGIGAVSSPEPLEFLERENFENLEDFMKYNFRVKYNLNILKIMKKIFSKSKKPYVLVSHNSPYNTKLDLIKNKNSYANGKHYGSIICKFLIKKFSPIVCFSGHIHEGFGTLKINKTTCFNTGFNPKINILVNINIKKRKIEKYKILS